MNDLQDKIIADASLESFGGHLQCTGCDEVKELSPVDISTYMKTGWPKHCGYTMTWITKNQELQNAKQNIKS